MTNEEYGAALVVASKRAARWEPVTDVDRAAFDKVWNLFETLKNRALHRWD